MSYLSLAKTCRYEEVIKQSSFLVVVYPVVSIEEVEAQLAMRRQEYPDASHHCWAYRLKDSYRFSDDGEPSGTAGRPMLEVLSKRQLLDVLAVVTRYFGGTKLGAGGLVRAYSGSLARALNNSEIVEIKERRSFTVAVPFAFLDVYHRLLTHFDQLVILDSRYTPEGLEMTLELLAEDMERFALDTREASRGQISYRRVD